MPSPTSVTTFGANTVTSVICESANTIDSTIGITNSASSSGTAPATMLPSTTTSTISDSAPATSSARTRSSRSAGFISSCTTGPPETSTVNGRGADVATRRAAGTLSCASTWSSNGMLMYPTRPDGPMAAAPVGDENGESILRPPNAARASATSCSIAGRSASSGVALRSTNWIGSVRGMPNSAASRLPATTLSEPGSSWRGVSASPATSMNATALTRTAIQTPRTMRLRR